jgi:hypothetical protein
VSGGLVIWDGKDVVHHQNALRPAVCAAVLCLIESLASPAFAADDDALVLTQVSEVTGPAQVYISKSALKVVNKRDGSTIIAHAPQWKVEFFNPLRKVLYETTPQQFTGQVGYSGVLMVARTNGLQAKRGNAQNVAGLNSIHIMFNHPVGDGSNRDEYFVFAGFNVPPQISTILQKYYVVPNDAGIPMRYIHYAGPARQVVLDTKASQRTKLPVSTWAVPDGYARAKAATEVTLSDGTSDLIKDMADGLGGHH